MGKLSSRLERMAQFRVAVYGELWDRTDQMVSTAEIRQLSDEDRRAVKRRVKEIVQERHTMALEWEEQDRRNKSAT